MSDPQRAKDRPIVHLFCNAHIDPVWRWGWEEGAREAISTFKTAANLLDEYPELIFNQNEPVERYVLLITNGRPDCGFSQGPGSCADGGDTQNVIGQLLGKEVSTFVIAPGQIDPDAVQCLRDLAVAGGTATQPSYFHAAQDPPDLNNEIGEIIRTIAMDACTLDLEGVRIQETTRLAVTWKNMPIPHDRNNGWDLTGNGFTITLRGTSCTQLLDEGPGTLAVYPDCNPPVHH